MLVTWFWNGISPMKTKEIILSYNPYGLVCTQSMRNLSHTNTIYNHMTGGLTTFLSMTKISSTTSSRWIHAPCHVHSLLVACCFYLIFFTYYLCFVCSFFLLFWYMFCFLAWYITIFSGNKCYQVLRYGFWMRMWLRYEETCETATLV